MEILLTAQEMYHSGLVGYRRQLESVVRGRRPRFPQRFAGELFATHIIGAMAECAVAKGLGLYWSHHEGKFSGGDVGELEVRWSMRDDVKVRERDRGVIVSVSGEPPAFRINGFALAAESKRPEWKLAPRNGPPAYFVPHRALYPIERLIGDRPKLRAVK